MSEAARPVRPPPSAATAGAARGYLETVLWVVLHCFFLARSAGRAAVDRAFHLAGLAFLEPRRGLTYVGRKLQRLLVGPILVYERRPPPHVHPPFAGQNIILKKPDRSRAFAVALGGDPEARGVGGSAGCGGSAVTSPRAAAILPIEEPRPPSPACLLRPTRNRQTETPERPSEMNSSDGTIGFGRTLRGGAAHGVRPSRYCPPRHNTYIQTYSLADIARLAIGRHLTQETS